MICSRRNGNQSLLIQYNHHVVPAQSYVSYPDVSLSKTFLSDACQLGVDYLDS